MSIIAIRSPREKLIHSSATSLLLHISISENAEQ
jgi:hypothetical protein